MKKSTLSFAAAATSTFLSACLFSGETSDPARANVSLEIKASPGSSPSSGGLAKTAGLVLGDTTGIHVDLTEARLAVSRIKLESESGIGSCDSSGRALKKEGDPSSRVETAGDSALGNDRNKNESESETEREHECEDANELALKGPFVIDLVSGASTPDLGTLSLPVGTYDKVKIELHHGQDDSALGGHSLVAQGNLVLADGSSKPFSIALNLDENLRIKSDSGLKLDPGALQTVAVKLLAGDWFTGLDFAGCLGAADPAADTLVVTEDSPLGKCLDAEHRIKDNFRGSFHADEKDGHEDSTGHSGEGH